MSTIQGRAKKYEDGKSIDYVLIFRWIDGTHLGKAVPNKAGNWTFYYDENIIVGITYVAYGCEPITHGPYEFTVST